MTGVPQDDLAVLGAAADAHLIQEASTDQAGVRLTRIWMQIIVTPPAWSPCNAMHG